jgi:hypothetical protein
MTEVYGLVVILVICVIGGGLRANSCHLTYFLILTMPMHFVTIKAASHNSGAILMITLPQGGPMAIGLCT